MIGPSIAPAAATACPIPHSLPEYFRKSTGTDGDDQRQRSPRAVRGPARLIWCSIILDSGAVEKTRTSTEFPPQRPQRCASTSSATTACLLASSYLGMIASIPSQPVSGKTQSQDRGGKSIRSPVPSPSPVPLCVNQGNPPSMPPVKPAPA